MKSDIEYEPTTACRCGCDLSCMSYYDDEPSYQYEIVLCMGCGATWAYDYDPEHGNVGCGGEELSA